MEFFFFSFNSLVLDTVCPFSHAAPPSMRLQLPALVLIVFADVNAGPLRVGMTSSRLVQQLQSQVVCSFSQKREKNIKYS
jgi:hypothetical protein